MHCVSAVDHMCTKWVFLTNENSRGLDILLLCIVLNIHGFREVQKPYCEIAKAEDFSGGKKSGCEIATAGDFLRTCLAKVRDLIVKSRRLEILL